MRDTHRRIAAPARADDLRRRRHRPVARGAVGGIGSQVQKPLAVVVVTGMMLAPVVILVTLTVLISFSPRRAR